MSEQGLICLAILIMPVIAFFVVFYLVPAIWPKRMRSPKDKEPAENMEIDRRPANTVVGTWESGTRQSQSSPEELTMEYAGVWRRLGAYLVDIIPITLLVILVFVVFFGFGDTYAKYSSDPGNLAARVNFLIERNRMRDISFLLWVIYGAVLEGSVLQGTLGKNTLGIRVVDKSGRRISHGRSIARNLLKVVSLTPFGLGFVWAVFSKERKTWHDMIAKTRVIMG